MECAKILDQMKAPLPDEVEEMARGEADVGKEKPGKPVSTAVVEAGKAGEPELGTDGTTDPGSVLSEPANLEDEAPPKKRRKDLTLEEYEAMLDAENGPGGFLEGGDIAGASHQDA